MVITLSNSVAGQERYPEWVRETSFGQDCGITSDAVEATVVGEFVGFVVAMSLIVVEISVPVVMSTVAALVLVRGTAVDTSGVVIADVVGGGVEEEGRIKSKSDTLVPLLHLTVALSTTFTTGDASSSKTLSMPGLLQL